MTRLTKFCGACKKKIEGKLKHSLYCKQCADDMHNIRQFIHSYLCKAKKKYPEWQINIIIKMVKKHEKER